MTATATSSPFNSVNFLQEYEDGHLSDAQVIAGFQELINSGLAWKLQGSYGRMAQRLIDDGLCVRPLPKQGAGRVGQFMGVVRDQYRKVGAKTYRVLVYSAYNAQGLVGSENNGIAVVSDEDREVIADCLGVATAGSAPTAAQLALFDKLLACSDDEFKMTVNTSGRARHDI